MFSAKNTFAEARSPMGMQECNEVARAVSQNPSELVAHLGELQNSKEMTPTERTLAIILRGILLDKCREVADQK